MYIYKPQLPRTSDNDERRLGVLQLHSGTLLASVHGWMTIHAAKTPVDPPTWDLVSRILPVTTPCAVLSDLAAVDQHTA